MAQENLQHLNNLKKYPEFYALKEELQKFRDKMYNIEDISLSGTSRIPLDVEIAARIFAAEKVQELFFELGLWEKDEKKRISTFE